MKSLDNQVTLFIGVGFKWYEFGFSLRDQRHIL